MFGIINDTYDKYMPNLELHQSTFNKTAQNENPNIPKN